MSEAGNQSASETTTAVADTPPVPPWKQAWNTLADTVTKALQGPVEPSKPWERTWGGRQGLEAPTAPSTPQFDTVFNKLVQAESGGVHKKDGKLLTSGAGAGGITQLMRKTAAKPGYGVTPVQDDSEKEYLRFGKDYLQALLKEFNGDYEKALAAYNAGPGNVKKAIKNGADNWKAHLPKPSETLPYIKKILGGQQPAQQSAIQPETNYGKRQDGTEKGKGFYGEVPAAGGKVSTEISIGVNLGGKEMEIPTMVPGLTKPELDSLLRGDRPSDAIVQKAVDHAKQRIKQGKSPFAGKGEDVHQVPK